MTRFPLLTLQGGFAKVRRSQPLPCAEVTLMKPCEWMFCLHIAWPATKGRDRLQHQVLSAKEPQTKQLTQVLEANHLGLDQIQLSLQGFDVAILQPAATRRDCASHGARARSCGEQRPTSEPCFFGGGAGETTLSVKPAFLNPCSSSGCHAHSPDTGPKGD